MTQFNVTQVGAEVWQTFSPHFAVTQVGVEVWQSLKVNFVASQLGVEVWQSVAHLAAASGQATVFIAT